METKIPGIRVIDEKLPISIPAKGEHRLLNLKKSKGRLRYIVVNLQVADVLELHIKIDGQDVFARTPQEVAAAQNNCLGIQAVYGAGGMLQSQVYTSSNYGIVLDFSNRPISFEKELLIEIKNRHATTAYSTQAVYGLYEVD